MASFLLRAALVFAASYAVWLPLQALFTRLLAAAAAPLLRLVEDPPLVTALVARRSAVLIHSNLSGPDAPLASWSTETIGVFVLAPFVLVLAAPVGRWSTRSAAAIGALAVAWCVCVGIAVTQIQLVVQTHATERLGITVHTPAEQALLTRLNDGLHVIGMLALPALLFLATYALGRWPPRPEPGGGRRAALRPWIAAAAIVGLSASIVWLLPVVVGEPATEPGEMWAKLLRLNPGFAPAQINAGLHLQAAGKLDEAVELYRSARLAHPDLPEVHYNLGNALLAQGLNDQAIESYVAVLRLAPGHVAAHRNLGLALARAGRPCEAVPHLERSTGVDEAERAQQRLALEIDRLREACGEPGP